MKKEYKFDILTNLFATGADSTSAEIRASAIRGELRWWFRVLGGFADDTRSVSEQETEIFGGVHGGAVKSNITLRVMVNPTTKGQCKDADALAAGQNTPLGYLLFPLRSKKDRNTDRVTEDHSRGFFPPNEPKTGEAFSVLVLWNGEERAFREIEALVSVWGQLGSLGFRSRRCMGALAFHGAPPCSLSEALRAFKTPEAVALNRLNGTFSNASSCTSALSNWLKGWRSHGRTPDLNDGPGFRFAKIDHDAGLDRKGDGMVMRPPLGLPIIQKYSGKDRPTNEWTGSDCERFASPVLLRPFRKQDGSWTPLVMFVENRMWPQGRWARITFDKQNHRLFDRPVSDELIEAMRNDHTLRPFKPEEV